MYCAPHYTTQNCSLVEYGPVINNLPTSSLFPSAYQIKYVLSCFSSCFLYLRHFVWQAQETRSIKSDRSCPLVFSMHTVHHHKFNGKQLHTRLVLLSCVIHQKKMLHWAFCPLVTDFGSQQTPHLSPSLTEAQTCNFVTKCLLYHQPNWCTGTSTVRVCFEPFFFFRVLKTF